MSNMVMSVDDVRRAITRIAHEILERQQGSASLALVGLQRGGAWLADAIAAAVNVIEPHATVPVGYIDVSMHRDDIGLRPVVPGAISRIDFAVDGTTVVLVDDVLFTGRTVRAALDALIEFGRPRAVRLAVIVLAIGFVPVLILAWAFEITPEGVKRDEEVDRSRSISADTGRKLNRAVVVLLVVAVSYFAVDKFVLARNRRAINPRRFSRKLRNPQRLRKPTALYPACKAARWRCCLSLP